ncbi:MAG: extracellular solute-binding protein [Treponema sp.]|jgi:spermidine/putrescine-binding protein|nr:extracellular solute-binding protein [Treponema sp.]
MQNRFEGLAARNRVQGDRLVAGHATLPFGTRILVTNPATNEKLTVQIGGRIPDGEVMLSLSPAAADKLGMPPTGITRVQVDVMRRNPGAARSQGAALKHQIPPGNRQQQLALFSWADMFPQEILTAFKRETGIEVVYIALPDDGGNEDMLATLRATQGAMYDLVIADDYIIEFVLREGLAQVTDKKQLPNFRNIDHLFQYQFYDPANAYTIPYGAGIQTIVYDPSKVKKEITGYADLWDSSFRNSLGIVSNYRVVMGMALKTLGYSYNTEEKAEIDAAGQKLRQLVPNIKLMQDAGLSDALLKGEISAAVMYTNEAIEAKMANPRLKMIYPQEGIGFGIMAAFIPSRAPNVTAAHRFLNFIMDPQRGAKCFEYLMYYCTYAASEEFIGAKYQEYLVAPDLENFEMIQAVPVVAETAHMDNWRRFQQVMSQNQNQRR